MLDERKKCPICKLDKFKILYSLSYNDDLIQKFLKKYYKERISQYLNELAAYNYVILECLNCSLKFQKYIPNEKFSKIFYEQIIDDEESKNKMKKLPASRHWKDFELINKIIKKNNQNISIFEFGSGNGEWACEAKKLNYDTTVYEYSIDRIETLKKKGLNVCDNINLCKKKFDIIFSNQVFEHIPNPAETLELLMPLLKKDGYILLKFPSSFMFKRKLKDNYQPKKDCAHPLEHINILNRKAFIHLTKSLNLEVSISNRHSIFNYKKYLRYFKDFFYFNQVLIRNKKN
tara:strand:- start:191 stop:1057 length:867 start_codon:yes stop_codon:yes gene_type:complete